MASEPKPTAPAEKETAQNKMFNDTEFVKRYKQGELLTGEFALELLHQMNLQSRKEPIHFLDLACGPGTVTKHAINIRSENDSPSPSEDRFTCADLAPAMLDALKQRMLIEEWPVTAEQVEVLRANMTDTNLPSDTYDYLGCNFGPCLAPEPVKTFKECYRMLKPGGVAGWTTWVDVGWFADMTSCFEDIRAAAEQKVTDGTGSEPDQLLSKLPLMPSFDVLTGHFAGVDVRKLRADGVEEDQIPRWDKEEFVKAQVVGVGFQDVQTKVLQRDFAISLPVAVQMIMPLVGILSNLWSEEERQALKEAPLQERVKEWWEKRFLGDDVKDGQLVWNGFRANLITGTKAK